MRVICRAAAGAAVAVAALAGPAAASASFDFSQIDLKASNGYTVRIVGNNQPYGSGNFVGLTTHKNHAYTSYDTGGISTAKHMKADLTPFGKIDVRFHPKDTTHPPLNGPHCHGDYKQTKGIWKGKIKFEGEDGYTKLSVGRAEGKHVVNSEHCNGGGRTTHKNVRLRAQSGSAFFTAEVRKKDGAKPEFSIFYPQSLGTLSIFRTAAVHGSPSQFAFNPTYTNATVNPPAPFSGSATFSSPSTWSGSLQVDLIGAPNTVIAGLGWSASLGELQDKR